METETIHIGKGDPVPSTEDPPTSQADVLTWQEANWLIERKIWERGRNGVWQVEKLGHTTAWGRVHPGSPHCSQSTQGQPRMRSQHKLDGTAASHAPHRKDRILSPLPPSPASWATAQKSATMPSMVTEFKPQFLIPAAEDSTRTLTLSPKWPWAEVKTSN